jgi:hypothetical protein
LHQAWLHGLIGIGWGWLTATGALLASRGALLDRRAGLTLQAECEHLLREDFADFDDEVFELSQFGAPGGTLGSPEAIGQVFGDAFDIGARFFYLWTPFLVACHPWLPFQVTAKRRTD